MRHTAKSNARSIISLIGFILFGLFSYLQANDIVQYGTAGWLTITWLVGYGLLSILCLINFFRPFPSRYIAYTAVTTFVLAIFRGTQIDFSQPLFCFIAPEEFAKRNPAGNETGGLVIVTIWIMLIWFTNRKAEHRFQESQTKKESP